MANTCKPSNKNVLSGSNFDSDNLSTKFKHQNQVFFREIKAHYNLRTPKSNKPTMVYLVVYINKKQTRISTGYKVYPKQWYKSKAATGVTLSKSDNANNCILNSKIEEMNIRFEEYKYYLCTGTINHSTESLKSYMESRTIIEPEKVDLVKVMKEAITKDINIKDGTRANYLRFISKFESFVSTLPSYELNSALFKDFQNWCIENVKGGGKKEKASPDSINKIVNMTLACIKNYLVMDGYVSNSVFNEIVVKDLKSKETDDEIALRDDEVLLIHNYKCDNKRDEEIKDLFVLECTTGQRLSDIDKVANNIEKKDGRTFINLVQDKTTEKVQVDIIFKIALDIIDKYNCQLPTYDRKIYNKRIKEIAKQAGITGVEDIVQHLAGENNVTVIKKDRYKCISSHTGRRTFITMLSLRGWEYNQIARYSGHSTLNTVQTYDKSKVGTKTKLQFEDTKKYHPELLLEMVDLDKRVAKPVVEKDDVPVVNPVIVEKYIHTEVSNEATYGIDREADISNLTKEELDFINRTMDEFSVGSPSIKVRKIINSLVAKGVVIKLSE